MPHSIRASADPISTYSVDHMGPKPSKSSPQLGVPSTSSNRTSRQSLSRGESRSGPHAYVDRVGTGNLDEFLQKHLGSKDSMIANYNNSSQQRKQYYEEHFQYKDNHHGSVRERVQRVAPVIAELRTNVIIKDEYTLVTDLSCHLAARYTRPDSSIMVNVDHSACLAMGGTFEPCYLLTVTTVPSQLGPTMNKRNAALIQSFMGDILSVPQERGIVKFVPVPEENFATNGTTMLGEIEKQEKQQTGENASAMRRTMNSMGKKSMPSTKKSMPKLGAEQRRIDSKSPEPTAPASSDNMGDVAISPTTTVSPPDGVFELPATESETQRPATESATQRPAAESERQRPATCHTPSSSVGSNGLRMNGISNKLNPKSPGKPKSRPRTFSGGEAASIQAQIKSNAAFMATPVPLAKGQRPPSFLKSDPIKLQASSRPTTPRPRHSGAPLEDRAKPRDSYLNGSLGAPTASKESGAKRSMDERQMREKEKKANMAKRRSTITSIPKLEPPPIPDSADDRKSTKSMRVGKRKSFLAAFRRSVTPGV